MKKLKYIEDACLSYNINISESGSLILMSIYNTTYHNKDEFKDSFNELYNAKLIEQSDNKYIISVLGDTIVEEAAKLFYESESNDVKLLSKNLFVDLAVDYMNGKLEIEKIDSDRNNVFIVFKNPKFGLRSLEIKNKNEIRVSIRNSYFEEAVNTFSTIGMVYRSGPSHTYFDMERTDTNIKLLIDTIINYFNMEEL